MLENKKTMERICPACNHKKAIIRNIYNIKDAYDRLPLPKPTSEAIFYSYLTTLWGGDQAEFLECQNCKLCYANPFIPANEFHYNLIYKSDEGYSKWSWEFELTYNHLENMKKDDPTYEMNILEIGAGNGSFIKKTSSITQKEKILTIEYSSYAKEQLEKFGLKCEQKSFMEIDSDLYKDSFDAVCMFHVLEHMNDLNELFIRIAKITKKNGFLFISIPNNRHQELFERYDFFEDVPPIHISRWNRKSLEIAARMAGFQLEDYQIESTNRFLNLKKYYSIYRRSKFKKLKNNLIRKSINRSLFMVMFFTRLKNVFSILQKDLGKSQWVCLKKIQTKIIK